MIYCCDPIRTIFNIANLQLRTYYIIYLINSGQIKKLIQFNNFWYLNKK